MNQLELLIARTRLNAPWGLSEHIIKKIIRRQKQESFIWALICSLVCIASIGVVFHAGAIVAVQLEQSGTAELISLVWTDLSLVVDNNSDFVMSVVSALPLLPLAYLFLGILFAVIFASCAIATVKQTHHLHYYEHSNLKRA